MLGSERDVYEERKIYQDEIKAFKESINELLSALKVVADEVDDGYVFNDTIERAEALV